MSRSPYLLLTCEHASNALPPVFSDIVPPSILKTHRAFDRGAQTLFSILRPLSAAAFQARYTRLLIDLNRSPDNEELFSRYTRHLSSHQKEALIAGYYRPFREQVREAAEKIEQEHGRVLHVSVHSFTPILRGKKRDVDVGFLYDPARPNETELAKHWIKDLTRMEPGLVLRRNHPYRGVDDGHTTELRKQVGARYAGVELELNQRFVRNPKRLHAIGLALRQSLSAQVGR